MSSVHRETSARSSTPISPRPGSTCDSGRLEDAERVVDRSLEVAATTDFWEYRGAGHEVRALILGAAGRHAEATEALETAVQAYRDKGASVAEGRARALLAEL